MESGFDMEELRKRGMGRRRNAPENEQTKAILLIVDWTKRQCVQNWQKKIQFEL
jgi:hypothetical protein